MSGELAYDLRDPEQRHAYVMSTLEEITAKHLSLITEAAKLEGFDMRRGTLLAVKIMVPAIEAVKLSLALFGEGKDVDWDAPITAVIAKLQLHEAVRDRGRKVLGNEC